MIFIKMNKLVDRLIMLSCFLEQVNWKYNFGSLDCGEKANRNLIFFCLTRLYIHTIIAAYFTELLFSIRVMIPDQQ